MPSKHARVYPITGSTSFADMMIKGAKYYCASAALKYKMTPQHPPRANKQYIKYPDSINPNSPVS